MDNYKQLRKLEISLEGKLSRKLNKVFKGSNVDFKIRGCNGPMYFDSKETGWTLFWLGCIRDCDNLVSDFTFHLQGSKEIPSIVLENKQVLLDTVNLELKDYFKKSVVLR